MPGGFLPRITIPKFNNPLRLLPINTKFDYEKLPVSGSGSESSNGSPFNQTTFKKYRWRSPSPGGSRFPMLVRMSFSRFVMLAITSVICLSLIIVGGIRGHARFKTKPKVVEEMQEYPWEHFEEFTGLYNGLGALVTPDELLLEQDFMANGILQIPVTRGPTSEPSIHPVLYNPYTEFVEMTSGSAQECFLDVNDTIKLPDIYAYPGMPQGMTDNFLGSYEAMGLRDDVCFDRFGRLGPYGYGYPKEEGGLGLADKSENSGSDAVWEHQDKIDYSDMNWGEITQRCYAKNQHLFKNYSSENEAELTDGQKAFIPGLTQDQSSHKTQLGKKSRQAYILRSYTGYQYDDHQLLTMRAMINELSLKSGGEYDVHLLVQVRDESIPIYTDKKIYQKVIERNVPEEFWGITTLWSEAVMRLYYPGPFPGNFDNPSGQGIHGVYRGAHFPLFWFAQQHPEYDYYWNWEMDLRYTGHYYEFNKKVTEWAKQQPRKGLWERSAQYYIPRLHGSWDDYQRHIENDTLYSESSPVWGPAEFKHDGLVAPPNDTYPEKTYFEDNYEWGVGEEADFISFNPIFDPTQTNWVFRNDMDGFNIQYPMPPRRVAIITVARLSKRLLDIAHREVYEKKHTMFPEMWPPTIALHHGLKAVYAPHPVYFDRNWDLEYMDQVFNHPKTPEDSVFGNGENNHLGSTFYYNSMFAGALWRRWFGYKEEGHGGSWHEQSGSGRMCLKSILFHPIKYERGPTD